MSCPKCGGAETVKHGIRMLSGGARKQRRKCKGCGYVFTAEEMSV